MAFHFRITRSYDDIQLALYTFLRDTIGAKKYLVYQHDADEEISRTHIHGICEECDVKSPKTFRKQVADYFKLENGDYAVGEGIGKNPGYMSKGRLDPCVNFGYTEEYVASLKANGYDVKKDKLKAVNGKIVIERDVREVKKTDLEMIEEIAKRCDNNKTYDTYEIAKEIVNTWKKNKKRGHSRLLEEWIDAVRYYSKKEDNWIDQVVQRYARKFSG